MLISEIYQSIQGEGRLTGTSSIFVRTSGCNLRCSFCDTPFASWEPEGESFTPEEILESVVRIAQSTQPTPHHIVLTGGEPMLPKETPELCQLFHNAGFHITIETAGTLFKELICDLMSISPKMSNSTPSVERGGRWREKHERTRYQPLIARQLIERHDYQLKFVADTPDDICDIRSYLQDLDQEWPRRPELISRVMLMPQGVDQETLKAKESWIKEQCDQFGFTFCPRLHIEWYGNKRGT